MVMLCLRLVETGTVLMCHSRQDDSCPAMKLTAFTSPTHPSSNLLPALLFPCLPSQALMEGAGVPVVPGYHGEDQAEGRLQVRSI